jgi:chemotaxis protein histidine kinase CheA
MSSRARNAQRRRLSPTPQESAHTRRESTAGAWAAEWSAGLALAIAEAKKLAARDALAGPRDRDERDNNRDNEMMRALHLIKGFAQSLGLVGVQAAAHALESNVSALRQDHATSRSQLDAIQDGLRKIEGVALLLKRAQAREAEFGSRGGSSAPADSRGELLSTLFSRIESVARGIALELGVHLKWSRSGGESRLRGDQARWIEAALLHAVRNSLDHGDSPDLSIRLAAWREGKRLVIECRDDGRGIDPERVREAARARHPRFDAEMGSLTDAEALQLLFLPGLSLSRGVSRLSGRGYGLDIVREAIETRLGGAVRIESRLGQGTCLRLELDAEPG